MPYKVTIETQVKEIPYGNEGILVSVSELVKIIKDYRKSPEIRLLAEDIVQSCPSKDFVCEATKIFDYVKKNIRFARDPYRVEMLRSPLITLDRKNGDCDDHTILVNSLLQSIGHPTRVVLVASRPYAPKNFNHIFTEVKLSTREGDKWIPIDTTVSKSYFGWLPTGFNYKRIAVEE